MLERLNSLIHQIEQIYDRFKWAVRRRLGISPVTILSYDGYGTPTHLHLLGRVVADYNVSPAAGPASLWRNIRNMIRRFRSHEIPYARVQASFYDHHIVAQADQEGHFRIESELQTPLPADQLWHTLELTMLEPAKLAAKPATGRVLIPSPSAAFGVISDLDDTVIQTNVVSKIKAVRNTFLRNAHTRLAFPGVSAFYQALHQDGKNPLFYVSNMPWNLHDLMRSFFEIQHIPPGPMRLTDLGLTESHLLRPSGRAHKLGHIFHILDTFPDLPFILIGDAGEEDSSIYVKTLQTYPDRIKAIYIRDIPGHRNAAAIQDLIHEAAQLHVDLVLTQDTLGAAEHAAEHGFITSQAIENVRAAIQHPPD